MCIKVWEERFLSQIIKSRNNSLFALSSIDFQQSDTTDLDLKMCNVQHFAYIWNLPLFHFPPHCIFSIYGQHTGFNNTAEQQMKRK